MQTKQQIVALWRRIIRTYRGRNPVLYIVVHMTGNTDVGADAPAHADLQSRGNARRASWHETVDDREAIQSYPATARCWHSGKGKDRGNMSSYAIEICVNSDGDYEQAVRNGAERVRQLRAEHGVPLSNVLQHYDLSGKNCPDELRDGKDGIDWADFLVMSSTTEAGNVTPAPSKPSRPPAPSHPTNMVSVDGYWGKNFISALQRDFHSPVDGVVSKQSAYWVSRNPALTSGWEGVSIARAIGSPLMGQIQDWVGTPKRKRDRLIGPDTIKRLQRKLKKIGYYSGRIDGRLDKGSLTVRGFQHAHNDGKVK